MSSERTLDIVRRAQLLCDGALRPSLEATHPDDFVAIEPDSGVHFVAASLSEAIQAARSAYPDRISFAIRIGHPSAVHLGVLAT